MHKFKNIFLIFLLFFSVLFIRNTKAIVATTDKLDLITKQGEIVCATNAEFPPWEYLEGENFKGIDIDLAELIAERLGVKLKINDVAYDAIIFELANNKCDIAIAAMSSTEEKAKSTDFTDSYFSANQVIITNKTNKNDVASLDELPSKKIGVMLGTTGHNFCVEKEYNGLTIYNKLSDAITDLIDSNNIDAIVSDQHPAEKYVKKYPDKLEILSSPLFTEDYRIAVPKNNPELCNKLNEIIGELKSENKIQLLLDKYTGNNSQKTNGILDELYDNLIYKERYKLILNGLLATCQISIFSVILGLFLGILTAVLIITESKKFKNLVPKFKPLRFMLYLLRIIAKIYVNLTKGTPIVCQLFIMYYIILNPIGINKIWSAIFVFGINSGAYVSGIIRSGFFALDHGQIEAAYALGLNNRLTFWHVMIPQMFKHALAGIFNELIQLFKETAIAGLLGVVDLSRAGEIIRSQTLTPLVPLLSVAIIYFIISCILSYIMKKIELKLRKSEE
ncbi:MAG: ABC transporter substrate-binding protein/permease [Candidatus Improbicoccus devescovinae]|nr:MAG: ABC transporter substrate-binding protein/permease [Candidatus Improbicoccus devescovinae]